MSFNFGVFSSPKVVVYASGYKDTYTVTNAAYTNVTLTEQTDSNSAYDGTTFTAPYDGTYLCQVLIANGSTSHDATIYLSKNNEAEICPCLVQGVYSSGLYAGVVGRLITCALGDTITFKAKNDGTNADFTSIYLTIVKV